MVICENLKDKVIIVAENDIGLLEKITNLLKKEGFNNIRIAEDGREVYEILRSYYNQPERVGLIVINENLPQCQVMEMCQTLSNSDDGSHVPFIIMSSDKDCIEFTELESQGFDGANLIHTMQLPINFSEFILVVGFQLYIKHEQFLRFQQEEQLITELAERKVVDAKLKYLVVHDELTSLLNRQNFERQLKLILNRNNRLQQNGALLFVNIDRFSLINELEGFETGDRLLVDVVSIIRKLVTKNDLFARIGSDEFCLFLGNKTAIEIRQFAETIRKKVYEYRFFIGDFCYSITLSVGLSNLYGSTTVNHPGEWIARAKQACNMAKKNGRNLVWEYNEKDIKIQERHRDLYWVPLIRKALLEDRFFLVFQPIVDLLNGNISHYEVLIRMRGWDNETIGPVDFIPVAERMGLIHRIDLWVVEQAIEFLAGQPANISLAINLSSVAFQEQALLPTIREQLDIHWVDAKRITFEITETAAVENFEQTREMISKIRALGCKFALDDFGAGFCSFNYLKSFPVDYVKIDGQFIRNLINDETDQVLVRSMAEIATKLGKKTIAEFVETPETISKLREIGVDFGQGYVFGKPDESLMLNIPYSFVNEMRTKRAILAK